MVKHFIHRAHHPVDPAFLRDEHKFLEQERAALRVMEQHRDQLDRDMRYARRLATEEGIPLYPPGAHNADKLLIVIGIGNRWRRDDGAGPEVARRLHEAAPRAVKILEQEGEPTSLLAGWDGADEALVIDGVSSGAAPGTRHRFEVAGEPLPAQLFRPSTHALGVAEAVELARELYRLPKRLVVYGIEGDDFGVGEGLSAAVETAVAELVAELAEELGGRAR